MRQPEGHYRPKHYDLGFLDVDLTDKKSDISLPKADPGAFGLPWHEPRKVSIEFKAGKAADYVRERIWSSEQIIKNRPDGGSVLEMLSQRDEELMSFVRSFGENARLLDKPPTTITI